jgi:riboflavin kinase/FMN adenylyltransferase
MPRSALPPEVEGTVVTVGTFDGVHRGHRAVLREIEDRARESGLRSVLVTFDRHPLTVVRPEDAPPLLTTPDEKKEILAQSGLDHVAFLPFTRSLSLYEPEEFVELVLVERFRVRELVIGYDHGFGHGRTGGVDTLRSSGRRLGFDVDVVGEVTLAGSSVSSTRLREAVREGRMEEAARGLGRPYSVRGPVVHGMGRGRDLGFPTANLKAPEGRKLLPRSGIYAVRASLQSEVRQGLVHLGPRPTFAGSPPSLELYLLDFDRDIYGETVRVDFLARLRDVLPFGSAEELVEQMQEDRERARSFFASGIEEDLPSWEGD